MNFTKVFSVMNIVMVILGYILRKLAYKSKNKYLLYVSRGYWVLVGVFISSFLIIEGLVMWNISQLKKAEEIEKIEYVVVLGAGLKGDKVGSVLQSRLDEAIKYYNLNKEAFIIVSGGQGKDEVVPEAVAMYDYLVEQGVEPSKIIKEDQSTTTLENLKFIQEILKNRGDENKKILIVTNEFHLPRAMLISNILGMKCEGLASQTPFKLRVNYMIREYPTIIIDVVRSMMT